ncbi:MAG: metal ABC transporter ATP-binding protein [Chitinispirillaceae bacterium]|nr:metal ABC transporter ATP-binding protein [Chitinispirillaceae bacterium]
MTEYEPGKHCKQNCCSIIENLGVTIGGREIIHSINLHLHCGELSVIIGPNGSGKTTLLKAIYGEIKHTGRVLHRGVNKENTRKLRIGYVPQKLSSDSGSPMTVSDLFNATLTQKPIWLFHNRKKRHHITSALEQMNAEHLIDKKLSILSGGEIQRVLVALATIPVPDLLLLDEPVSGVDYSGLQHFYKAISNLRRTHDLSIVMVSHDISLSSQFADRLILLNKTIRSEGKPQAILSSPEIKELMGYGSIQPIESPEAPPKHHKGNEEKP